MLCVLTTLVSGVLLVFPRVFFVVLRVHVVYLSVLVSPYLSSVLLAFPGVCFVVVSNPSGWDVVWVCPRLHTGVGVAFW